MMDITGKLVEVFGRHLRPTVFGAIFVSVALLIFPALRVDPLVLIWVVLLFGIAFLCYEPTAHLLVWVANRASEANTIRTKRRAVLMQSDLARSLLWFLLQEVKTEFAWDRFDPMVVELDLAGIIVPVQRLCPRTTQYRLSNWYHEFVLTQRSWLLKMLQPDIDEVLAIEVGWTTNALRRVRA